MHSKTFSVVKTYQLFAIPMSIPAFASFINVWTKLAEDRPEWQQIIQPGLEKLEEYRDRLSDVHIIAMGEI